MQGLPGRTEQAHLPEAALGEATAEALGQIRGQALQQRIALGRAVPPTLLELDDAPARGPLAGRHPCMDATRCGVAGACHQRNEVAADADLRSWA